MKVLLLTSQYLAKMGGVGAATQRLARGLTAAGDDVLVIARDRDARAVPNFQAPETKWIDDIPVHFVSCEAMRGIGLDGMLQIVDAFRPQVVQSYFIDPTAFVGQVCAERVSAPHVVSIRGNDITKVGLSHPARIRLALRSANFITGVSSSMLEMARAIVGDLPGCTVPNSVADDFCRAAGLPRERARRAFGIPVDATVVGALHSRRWKKGGEYLEQVVRLLAKSPVEKLCFVLGGEPNQRLSDGLQRSFEDASRNGARRELVLVRPLEHKELAGFYRALDLFLITSLREGMPNTMLESMACGTPVAATAVDGTIDVLSGEPAGLLLNRFDPDQAAREIVDLLLDVERLSVMSDASRQLIARQYRLSHEVGRLQDIYRSLIDQHALLQPASTMCA